MATKTKPTTDIACLCRELKARCWHDSLNGSPSAPERNNVPMKSSSLRVSNAKSRHRRDHGGEGRIRAPAASPPTMHWRT